MTLTTQRRAMLASLAICACLVLAALAAAPSAHAQNQAQGTPADTALDALALNATVVLRTSDATWLPVADALAEMARADILLLGEFHDNPAHHEAQALALDAWAKVNAPERSNGTEPGRLGVAMEMLAPEIAETVDAVNREIANAVSSDDRKGLLDGLGERLTWEKRGWPQFATYRPIFETITAHKLRLLPANAPRELMGTIMRGSGSQAPGPLAIAPRLIDVLATELPSAADASLMDDLYEGHCKLLSREMLAPMQGAQRLRDAKIAEAVLSTGRRVALIAGNGHVRADYGVPWYLAQLAPGRTVTNVMLGEHAGGIEALQADTRAEDWPADYVWFTGVAERTENECDKLRERFSKKG